MEEEAAAAAAEEGRRGHCCRGVAIALSVWMALMSDSVTFPARQLKRGAAGTRCESEKFCVPH